MDIDIDIEMDMDMYMDIDMDMGKICTIYLREINVVVNGQRIWSNFSNFDVFYEILI